MATEENELESLCRTHFPDLTAAEIELLRTAPMGNIAKCGRTSQPMGRVGGTTNPQDWAKEQQIRGHLIRWLCTNSRASVLMDPIGIQVWGAMVRGSIDLSFVRVPFPLALINCHISDDLILREAEIPDLNLNGSTVDSIEAGGTKVAGCVFLRTKFQATGEVSFIGAQIGGDLDCSDATFSAGSRAISADRISVEGTVYLNKGFHAVGEVRFSNARIGGDFLCTGGHFSRRRNGEENCCALILDGIGVRGDVSLNWGFVADGQLSLIGAQIGGSLDCSGANLSSPPQTEDPRSCLALKADGATVKGCVFLTSGFYSVGRIEFLAAHIEKNLECISSTFRSVICVEGTHIQGGFHWLGIKNPEHTTLDLHDSSATRILDASESWPSPGNLHLDGFKYGRIAEGPENYKDRLNWLGRLHKFTPQPYRQLAQVLRDEGDNSGARHVLFEMESLRRRREDRHWYARTWSNILRGTIGYGYYPGRSLLMLFLLLSSGFGLFYMGYNTGNMAPIDKGAYYDFRAYRHLPSYYGRFHASMYSIENCFPGVKLGQADHWQPDPNPQTQAEVPRGRLKRLGHLIVSATTLDWFRSMQILFGPFFGIMFALSVTGLVRKD